VGQVQRHGKGWHPLALFLLLLSLQELAAGTGGHFQQATIQRNAAVAVHRAAVHPPKTLAPEE
jgi:hypothetical protein